MPSYEINECLENLGKMPVVMIEVQIGGYLCEDDIIWYDDVYACYNDV
ncbi:hypothetical protein N8090_02305 [Amylibacter sp.]|nr:hypothetical protein [Amylibacter sp.]MDC1489164.1 hypothetical protein [Amylibacter sp.]